MQFSKGSTIPEGQEPLVWESEERRSDITVNDHVLPLQSLPGWRPVIASVGVRTLALARMSPPPPQLLIPPPGPESL